MAALVDGAWTRAYHQDSRERMEMTGTGDQRKSFSQYLPPVLLCGFYLVALYFLSEYSWGPMGDARTGVLVATGLIIIWFAWETRQLGKETRRQTEMQMRPFIILKPAPQSHTGMAFEISNVGNGTAINVRVGYVSISASDEMSIRFPETVPVVRRGESILVTAQSTQRGRVVEPSGIQLDNLNPNYTGRTYQLDISFQDVESRPYFVKEIIGPRTLSIVGESLR